MTSTLRDLLADSSLGVHLAVGGDVDHPIRWVHVTELADASPYLQGDELVLTAGVWQGRGTSARDFVAALTSRMVAGIGYGLLRRDERVPPALVKACQREGVPLFVVPVDTPFVAISQWFVARVTEEHEAALRRTLQLTRDLLTAADATSTNSALTSIAKLLRIVTGHDVWIGDTTGRTLASVGVNTPEGSALALAEPDYNGDGWSVRRLPTPHPPATVVAVRATSDPEVNGCIEAALPVVGLVLARERAVRETERRVAGEAVSLVLAGQWDAAAARLQSYGLNPQRPMLAISCVVPAGEPSLARAERWRESSRLDGVIARQGDELLLILDAQRAQNCGGPVQVASSLAATIGALATGAGGLAGDVTGLRRSIVQAQQAGALARRAGGGAVLSHQQQGHHAFLLALQDHDVLSTFRETVLADLESYDTAHASGLVDTLAAFLNCGGHWQQTADALHLHVNTVRYRLEKVEKLTGKYLNVTGDRVDLWLALQATPRS